MVIDHMFAPIETECDHCGKRAWCVNISFTDKEQEISWVYFCQECIDEAALLLKEKAKEAEEMEYYAKHCEACGNENEKCSCTNKCNFCGGNRRNKEFYNK